MFKRSLLLGIVFLLLLSSFVSADLTEDLVSYWKLDEISGTLAEDSHGTNDGTANNARVFTSEVTGILNTGADFTQGDDYISIPDSESLSITGDITISFWVNAKSSQPNNDPFILSKGSFAYESHIQADSGEHYIRFVASNNVMDTPVNSFDYNVWTHYALSYDADGSYNIYKNGISIADGDSFGALTNDDFSLTFGRRTNGVLPSNIELDEVRIWSRALSSYEITELYNAPFSQDFEITAKDAFGLNLTNFTVDIINSTTTTTVSTTNGTVLYEGQEIVNLSFYNINEQGWDYINVSYSGVNASEGTFSAVAEIFDNTAPEVSLNPSNSFNSASLATLSQFDDTLYLNMTFSDDRDLYGFVVNITRLGLVYYNFSDYTISGTEYTFTQSVNVSSWVAGTYDIEIKVFDSKTRQRVNPGNETKNLNTEDFEWFRGTYEKTEPLLFSDEWGFLELTLTDDATIQNITAQLYIDGVLEPGTIKTTPSGYWKFSNNISFLIGVYDYDWVLEVTQSDSSSYSTNISGSIEFFEFGIDDCSTYTNEALKFNIFNEDTPSERLNAKLEIDALLWISTRENSRPFSAELTGANNYSLCLLNADSFFFTDMYIKYSTNNGFTHRYYLVNEMLSNETKNLSIYNFNTTEGMSEIKLTIRDYNTYQYFPNIITKLQRRYPGEAVWRTVQMDESGDFGLVFFNIKEATVDYRFLFYDRENNLLRTTEMLKFICSEGICDLTVTIDGSAEIILAKPVSVSYSLNEETKVLTIQWTDPDAETKKVRFRAQKQTVTGTALICDETQLAAAGTFTCDLSSYSGDVQVSIITEDVLIETKWVSLAREMLASFISTGESVTWTFGIMMTITMFGVFTGAVGSIIATLIGLIIVYAVGILNAITLTFIIIAAAIGIVIAIKIRG